MNAEKVAPEKWKRKCLNSVERKAVFLSLFDNYDTSTRLPPGAVTEAAERFKVSKSEVKTYCEKAKITRWVKKRRTVRTLATQ